jgi:hypothetical protein
MVIWEIPVKTKTIVMNHSSPPPLPAVERNVDADGRSGPTVSAPGPDDTYELFSGKIGGVPNVRKKDNLIQAAAVVAGTTVGAIAGWLVGSWPMGPLIGGLVGMTAGLLVSGFVLMIIGLLR